MKTVITLSPRDYDAVLFDLDGVLIKLRACMRRRGKKLFDEFLEQRAARTGARCANIDTDYRALRGRQTRVTLVYRISCIA